MDDLSVFDNFFLTQCGLTINFERGETVVLINGFTALLATSDAEIGDFIKRTHATNSACHENWKILIPESVIVALKALILEIEYRARCGALWVLAMLQALDAVQINCMRI